MNTRVFVSYTFRDGAVDEQKLKKTALIFSSFSEVFIDHLAVRTLYHPQLVIISKILRSHLIVVIESKSVYRSPWVLFELFLAKITLKPVIKMPVNRLE